MKPLTQWLALYGESHQNKTNQIIHKICVPLIAGSVMAFFWLIPIGPINGFIAMTPFLLAFYFRLSLKAGGLMLVQLVIYVGMILLIENHIGHLFEIAMAVFVVAWIGQFIGHKIEGKKPSFFQDLQFLFIGPLWICMGSHQKK